MAASFVNAASAISGATATSLNVTKTVAAGSNALIVIMAFPNGAGASTITWDSGGTNQAMTLIQGRNNAFSSIFQYGLLNPTVGTNLTLALSWASGSEVCAHVADFSGVDTSSFANAFKNTNADFFGTTSGAVTSNVTSAVGDIAIACFQAAVNVGAFTGATQNEFGNNAGTVHDYESQWGAGAATVAFSITPAASVDVFGASFDIAGAASSVSGFSLTSNPPVFPTTVNQYKHTWTSVSLTPATLPPKISGNAWIPSLDQPFFPTSYKAWLQPPPAHSPINYVTINSLPWYQQFEQPRFSTTFKQEEQPAEAYDPPQMVSQAINNAWYKQFDQPFFPTLYKTQLQPLTTHSPINYVTINSQGWYKQFDQPRFSTAYNTQHQTSFYESLTPNTDPVGISGMAWWGPFDQPFFKPVPPDRNTVPTQFGQFIEAGISGMAWWRPFEQPKFGPVALGQMPDSAQFGVFTLPAPISGMAWWKPFEPPFFPVGPKYFEHQTEFMSPPLPVIFVMASTSEDQPLVTTGQRAWLSTPQSFWGFIPPGAGTPVSGMAWWRLFEQPKFSTTFKQEEQPSFFEALIPGTLPVGISGMAWYGQFDQPRFSTAYPVASHPQASWDPLNIVTISSLPWYQQYDQPRVSTTYAGQSQPSEAFTFPPVLPTGIAWYKPFEPPFFPTLFKKELQPSESFITDQPILPAGISGIAWNINFDQPFFPTVFKPWLQPSFFESLTPATDPVGISGMAWYQPFVQPKVKSAIQSELLPGSSVSQLITVATISGMAWYQNFGQPRFSTSINSSVQSYSMPWFFLPPPRLAVGTNFGGSGLGHPRSNRSVRSGRSTR